MILPGLLTALAALSFILGIWQWILGRRFPLYAQVARPGFFPAISVLKPLKGVDAETESCLESWFTHGYPGDCELLFGVASESDPVCATVRHLVQKYPKRKAELVIANPVLGPNAKVSTLCYLFKKAGHEHLVISDADVFISGDLLSNLIAGLGNDSVGLVNCFYILARPQTLPMRMEAVAGNADFWTQVLQAVTLRPMDFALGAVMATRKRELQKAGGFESLLDVLADDYVLGNRVAHLGKKLEICTIPAECRSAPYGWRDTWEHQVRWGRTIRACRPAAFFFSILGNGTLWPLLAFAKSGSAERLLLCSALVIRMLGAASNSARLTRRWDWWIALVTPLLDLGRALVWIISFLGNEIVWRGERLKVNARGKLTRSA